MPRRAPLHRLLRSASVLFLLAAAAAASLVAALFARLTFSPARPAPLGCRPDGEGSWSIGVFYGDSPLSLRPIEDTLVSSNLTKAWPLANPVFTCAAPSQAGYPSNFVADPFLYIQGNTFYLFFETKNAVTLEGDIGVAVSEDKGATWKHLGIALDEKWHLSYPFVFSYEEQEGANK